MNICLISGSIGLTLNPSTELSVGTSRQPSSFCPSFRTTVVKASMHACRVARSRGRNTIPTE